MLAHVAFQGHRSRTTLAFAVRARLAPKLEEAAMSRIVRSVPASLILCLALAPRVTAQSVADIVDGMYASYERQASGVDNYTLVQRAMGVDITNYFEKELLDGKPVFRQKSAGMQGFSFGMGAEDIGQGDVVVLGPQLVEHGRYAGTEQLDGRTVHVIAVDDVSALDINQPTTPDNMKFEAKTARFYVDDAMMVPRRMEIAGDATTDGGVHAVTLQMNLLDYGDEGGLLIPHRAVMELQGLAAMIDPEMRAQFEEMQRQLAALPPDQRAMMERMLGPQMEQMRKMMSGEGDGMTIEVTVTEVRINSGPPSE
jgi:hypothetical protein